jgi:hypothetical protein
MWRAIDLVLRFAYVAAVPFLLPILNTVMPLTGLLIGIGAATLIALIGSDAWRARVESIRYVGRFLGGMGKLGDFYRRYPPKPLVFYLVYPLLLPVVLFMRVPRRELFLYRKLNVLALVIVVATGTYDYFRHWRPELTFDQFFSATLAVVVMQMIVTFMLITPIVTTLVLLREGGHHRSLAVLMVLMLATAGYGYYAARHTRTMTFTTWLRLQERTRYARITMIECEMAHPDRLESCLGHDPELRAMADALRAARKAANHADAVAAARGKLTEYYKPDEAAAFRLVEDHGLWLLFAHYGHKPAIWLGYEAKHYLIYPHQLPPARRKALDL